MKGDKSVTVPTMSQEVPDASRNEHEGKNRLRNCKTRTYMSVFMIAGFVTLIMMGHFYCALLVFWITNSVFNEITSLKRR